MKLETAKELKRVADEYGVELPFTENTICEACNTDHKRFVCNYRDDFMVEVYTTDELLEWLRQYEVGVQSIDFNYYAFDNQNHSASADTPSEALTLLAIELIKNKVIK